MTRSASTAIAVAITSLVLALTAGAGRAAEIKILAGSAIETTMTELIPKFELASGHKVSFDFDGAIGAMTERVRRGEAADVVIVSGAQIDSLAQEVKVVVGSRVDIAK